MAVEKKSSQFSLACTLLSRMVKEKQGCFNGGMHRPTPPATTMDLLTGIDVPAETHATKCTEPVDAKEEKSEELTIFYGGNVFVFDDFPEEKAKVLMQMAKSNSGKLTKHSTDHMLALTRKDSLQRFLNKRKERINAMAPYQVQAAGSLNLKKKMGAMAMATPPEETRPWLTLGQ